MSKPRVLVTRALSDASALCQALSAVGYEPIVVPLIERVFHVESLAQAARSAPDANWVVVTSPSAVNAMALACPTAFSKSKWAAVGPATQKQAEIRGFKVHLTPRVSTAAALVEEMGDLTGQVVFHPRADQAGLTTVGLLEAQGATVLSPVAYRNRCPQMASALLSQIPAVQATALMSGSAARRLAERVTIANRHRLGLVVTIGPSTSQAATKAGLIVHGQASPHTIDGLITAIGSTLSSLSLGG